VCVRERNSKLTFDVEMYFDHRDGRLYLRRGWPKFVKCYTISLGNILAFDYYAGNRELVVTIYGGRLSRREYDTSSNDDSDDDGSGGDRDTQTMPVKEEEMSEG
jgi:hypothetical protein